MVVGCHQPCQIRRMWFRPVIERWGAVALAKDLALPAKNVRRWVDLDSIPADRFRSVAAAAAKRGFGDITVEHLAELAEGRRHAAELVKDCVKPPAQNSAAETC